MFVMALDMLFMAGKATPFEHRVGGVSASTRSSSPRHHC